MSAASEDKQGGRPSAATAREPEAGATEGALQGAVPFAKRGAIYTMTAREGLDAAEVVKAAFRNRTIGAVTPRRLEVVAPDGPSTAGGKRARQTIRLVPVQGEGAPVMCGFLDVARKRVELRSHATVAQQYSERFAKTFDVTAAEYAGLCKDLEATLSVFRYEFAREADGHVPLAEGPRVQLTTPAPSSRTRLLNGVLAAALALILVGLLLSMTMR